MGAQETEPTLQIPETLRKPFAVIQKLGLFSGNKYKKTSLAIFYGMFPSVLILAAMLQYANIKPDVSEFASNLECIIGFVQLLGKIIVVASRQKDFIKLIRRTEHFINPDECEEKTKEELKFLSYATLRIQQLFLPLMVVAVMFIIISPVFGKALPIGIWNLEGYDLFYHIVLFLQPPTLTFSTVLVYSFDCMYLAFCAELIIQFRIVCHRLEQLTSGSDDFVEQTLISHFNEMKFCLQQHRFLLRFIQEFQDLYGGALLVEYLTDGPMICVELYAAFESNSFQLLFRHVMVFLLVTTQLSFFCIPANYIANEALSVADAAYFSNWYSAYFPSLKAPLLLMIQNSQQEVTIKASGLITINAITVLNILKVAWSACSIMRGLK